MRIDRHVYGSVSGYQTLARSEGILAGDLRILEAISIGQTSDPHFMRSLASSPGWVITPLGNRRALTRIAPGPNDDHNRPTIQKVTLVLSREDWDYALHGDIQALLGCAKLWVWDGREAIPAVEFAPPALSPPAASAESVRRVMAMLSLLERAKSAPVIVRENACTPVDFRLIEMLLPPSARTGMSLVYRSLSPTGSPGLICLADRAPVSTSAETYRLGQGIETSRYALAVCEAGFGKGVVPVQFVGSYRSFGMSARPSPPPPRPAGAAGFHPPTQVIVERMPRTVVAALLAACVILPVVTGVATYVLTVRAYAQRLATVSPATQPAVGLKATPIRLDSGPADKSSATAATERAAQEAIMVRQAVSSAPAQSTDEGNASAVKASRELDPVIKNLIGVLRRRLDAVADISKEKLPSSADLVELTGLVVQVVLDRAKETGYETGELSRIADDLNGLSDKLTRSETQVVDRLKELADKAQTMNAADLETALPELDGWAESSLAAHIKPPIQLLIEGIRADARSKRLSDEQRLAQIFEFWQAELSRIRQPTKSDLDLRNTLNVLLNPRLDMVKKIKKEPNAARLRKLLDDWAAESGFSLRKPDDFDRAKGLIEQLAEPQYELKSDSRVE